ncbi:MULTISPECIES: glycoside hydrolase/phage tail family protein [unclassified Roseovarius]|uniref:baseplate multidomain protein megatron n=1 Tax=unclassified Roseovarius TaxID=2614913 RepID=UPI00273EE378|nr:MULTISPECIES: glycoside hydrolase/phage tail family protein [unclassified Roseovarius]
MATILLSAAGSALGSSIGGSVLGLSTAVIGRFAGAVIGRSIDQRLLGEGSEAVESGKVSRLRLSGAGEGDAIAQIYGRMRVSGQVIWATEFKEDVTITPGSSGGKGSAPKPPTPETREYSYSVSIAVALCEGVISDIGRVWADGREIHRSSLNMRIYKGTRDQLPDPKMEAIEGAGKVPAYRGTAYVVIEDLDLGRFGNRVPQLNFEVSRPSQEGQPGADLDPPHALKGVALLPGSGEYALATSRVVMNYGPGSGQVANINTRAGRPDFNASLGNLYAELPNCRSMSLIVSWFGDDLRCDTCRIRPKVEQAAFDSTNMPWQVAGLTRTTAPRVVRDANNKKLFGGTPADASVVEAIRRLRQQGNDVMYYPFILMEQLPGNGLPDPYSDAADQPEVPWRGRITTTKAPGQAGSTDGTAAAAAEVSAFFGNARASHFQINPNNVLPPTVGGAQGFLGFAGPVQISPVNYSGPSEWGYRRFILHQAALCKAAGGVESFCIGSEMRALTQIRGANNSFPAVDELIDLAAEVRALLGPSVKIGYAADWSEYFGYQPNDGTGDRFFHLDPLWADSNIDFIGIDNYMPLSDWREGPDHADAAWESIYDLGYLQSNIEGGEGYDWYYASPEDEKDQVRTPITDGTHNEPWIWRYKDIRNWWSNPHHDRVGGVRQATPSPWVPQSKPVRFTEFGCASVDKGANQPNKFLDAKSSESSLPKFSTGRRDELMQLQYLRAMIGYWNDPANNPVSAEYGAPMLDMDHAYAWAWDTRPFPYFPNNRKLWSDGENYGRGHWLNGRMSSRTLASVVEEICEKSGLSHLDTSKLHGLVRGYSVDQTGEARGALQPLMLCAGFDAVERGGKLHCRLRDGKANATLVRDQLVRDPENDGVIEAARGGVAELPGRVRLRFVGADSHFEVLSEEAVLPDEDTKGISQSEMPVCLTRAEGRQTVERWLAEARVSTDTVRLTLPPSRMDLGAGDVVKLDPADGGGLFRVDRVEQMGNAQRVEGVRIEPESYRPIEIEDVVPAVRAFTPPVPVTPLFLDLPLLTGEEVPHAPHVAMMADPWPGAGAVYSSDIDADYQLNQIVTARAPIGITESDLAPCCAGLVDKGPGLVVKMRFGAMESVVDDAFLAGANLCAIGDGTPDGWEVFQFRDAELIAEDTYVLRHRLRGQLGTEFIRPDAWPAGSYVVRLDGSAIQLSLAEAKRGLPRHYRVGPADRPLDDPAYQHGELSFTGVGLRPYSPVHLRATPLPGGDLRYDWIRRTRVGGDRWDTPEVPLGEESERYLVRVMQGANVLREEMPDVPSWTYTATDRAADGVSGAFTVEVAQVSASYGAGRFATLAQGG